MATLLGQAPSLCLLLSSYLADSPLTLTCVTFYCVPLSLCLIEDAFSLEGSGCDWGQYLSFVSLLCPEH